ncbi:hypothetical protein [Bradyrhizobium sp.]|uniref:hypothetical protein n=1 Tax=Bradyrhizobium sp. TaxID=376 RepID=UPI003C7349F9
MKFSAMLLAVVVAIGLVGWIGSDRYARLFSTSIESTELGTDARPAPGSRN